MQIRQTYRLFVIACALALLGTSDVQAQGSTGDQANRRPLPAVFDGVGITEALGESLPQDLEFFNDSGELVRLGSLISADRPVILNFAYHNCPMLCSIMLESFAKTLADMDMKAGQDFDVITVSFSADETPDLAARQKAKYLERLTYDSADVGWHFLTGSQENIAALTAATGFGYKWVESAGEFAHPAALIFVSPEGVVTRYLHGMSFKPLDVRRAIVEASSGEVGTTLDRIIMYCFRYDATANSYVIHAQRLMKLAGFVTLLLVVFGLGIFWRRERRKQQRGAGVPTTRQHLADAAA